MKADKSVWLDFVAADTLPPPIHYGKGEMYPQTQSAGVRRYAVWLVGAVFLAGLVAGLSVRSHTTDEAPLAARSTPTAPPPAKPQRAVNRQDSDPTGEPEPGRSADDEAIERLPPVTPHEPPNFPPSDARPLIPPTLGAAPPEPNSGAASPVRQASLERSPGLNSPPVRWPQFVATTRDGSLWEISERFFGTGAYYRALFEHNRDRLPEPDRIAAGIQLEIPAVDTLKRLYPHKCPSD